jgi:hypothetical protein
LIFFFGVRGGFGESFTDRGNGGFLPVIIGVPGSKAETLL